MVVLPVGWTLNLLCPGVFLCLRQRKHPRAVHKSKRVLLCFARNLIDPLGKCIFHQKRLDSSLFEDRMKVNTNNLFTEVVQNNFPIVRTKRCNRKHRMHCTCSRRPKGPIQRMNQFPCLVCNVRCFLLWSKGQQIPFGMHCKVIQLNWCVIR